MQDREKQKYYEQARQLIAGQNLPAAVVAGAIATCLAAAAYGIAVSIWSFSYGFAAAGIGITIGLSMRYLGRGVSPRFSVIAAAFTVVGCMLGNLMLVITDLARATRQSPMDVVSESTLTRLLEQAASNLSLVHLVYWFVAVFCAAFLARRALSRTESLAMGLLQLND